MSRSFFLAGQNQRGGGRVPTLDPRPSRRHMQSMLIQTETTPNPATIKFLPGQRVMDAGTRDFATPEEAEASPLAEALFSLGDVEGVFFGRDFISVTAGPGSDWRALKPQVLGVLLDHFSSGAPLFRAASASEIAIAPNAGFEDAPEDADIIAQIQDLIETRVRPAVAQDGGDIVYRGYREGIVYLAMHGACSGCPSSTMTLKSGIESLLKHYVPEVETVEAV
jgi:Fe-S cluster biogenesis protein NfuA